MKWELFARLEQPSLLSVLMGGVAQNLIFCEVLCRSFFVFFVLFLLAIVFSVILRSTASDYLFGICNLFLAFSKIGRNMTDRLQVADKHHKVFRSAHIAIGMNPTRNISEMIGTKSNINMNTSTTAPSTCKLEDARSKRQR